MKLLSAPTIEDWQAENQRLAAEGWVHHTDYYLDGTIKEYAIKDEIVIDRTCPA